MAATTAVISGTCTGTGIRQVDRTMNHRRNGPVRAYGGAAAAVNTGLPASSPAGRAAHERQEQLPAEVPQGARRTSGHHETGLLRDSLHVLERDGVWHVVSEDYSYKTEPYYTILSYELAGKNVRPASSAVLDAYVVPICLERAGLAGIPVAEWGISQGYVPLPSIIYGLNYFATSADFSLVRDDGEAREVIAHVTNKGKYPFCYQKIPADATVHSCVSIFGRTAGSCAAIAGLAEKIYQLFSIPLVTMVFVESGNEYLLSSLSPAKYSRISADERALLSAYLSRQEFL
ncbi:MAG: RimK-like ATPgrasp N-terminal domain-containing protein [Methanoregula sp.]|nr:RimK-like ATPgrasp N-terminal domain-containing protein [Methanoregula sp.]